MNILKCKQNVNKTIPIDDNNKTWTRKNVSTSERILCRRDRGRERERV